GGMRLGAGSGAHRPQRRPIRPQRGSTLARSTLGSHPRDLVAPPESRLPSTDPDRRRRRPRLPTPMPPAAHNTLTAVIAAVTDLEDGGRRAAASLDAFLNRLAPIDRRRLTMLLRGVEWFGPLSRGRPRRFS